VSFILGLLSIFSRLADFRLTTRRHKLRDEKPDDPKINTLYQRTRRIGAWTWGLFYSQIFSFALGGGTIIYFWTTNYAGKL
jgi:hypothetical protein